MHAPQLSPSESQCGLLYEKQWVCGVKQGRTYLWSTACVKIPFILGPDHQPSFIFECPFSPHVFVFLFFWAASTIKFIVKSACKVMGKITDERQLYILEHCNKFRKDFQRKGHVNNFFRLHFIPKTAKLADLGRWAGPRRRCFLPGMHVK